MVRCHEVGGNALTVCVLSGPRASSILVEGSANLLSFHTTQISDSLLVRLPHRLGVPRGRGGNGPTVRSLPWDLSSATCTDTRAHTCVEEPHGRAHLCAPLYRRMLAFGAWVSQEPRCPSLVTSHGLGGHHQGAEWPLTPGAALGTAGYPQGGHR